MLSSKLHCQKGFNFILFSTRPSHTRRSPVDQIDLFFERTFCFFLHDKRVLDRVSFKLTAFEWGALTFKSGSIRSTGDRRVA